MWFGRARRAHEVAAFGLRHRLLHCHWLWLGLVAGVVGVAGCGDDLWLPEDPPSRPLTVMSYNLAQGSGDPLVRRLGQRIARAEPDVIAIQECLDCDEWLPRSLEGDVRVLPPVAGVTIAFDATRFQLELDGYDLLGENDDGWGPRVTRWALLSEAEAPSSRAPRGGIYVYSTHFCVPIRRDDDLCTTERQLEYQARILAHVASRTSPDTPVLLAGDFNVFEGFERGEVVTGFIESGFTDLFRAAVPGMDATTFVGNSWAPSGRLDYVFSRDVRSVLDAWIDDDDSVGGAVSDHYPVNVTFEY